jgi:hypothetical protein
MNSESITIKIDPKKKKEIVKLAQRDERTLSSFVRWVLMEYLEENK